MILDNFVGQSIAKKRAAKQQAKNTGGKDWRKTWKSQKADTMLKIKSETGAERKANRQQAMKGLGSWVQSTAGQVIDKMKANQAAQTTESPEQEQMEYEMPDGNMPTDGGDGSDAEGGTNVWLYVGIFGGLAVVAVVVLLMLKNRKKE